MLKQTFRWFAYCVVVFLVSGPTRAQKHKDDKPIPTSDKPAELSEGDKKKMAEIAERPEVKDEIQAEWDEVRRQQLEFVYVVNSSPNFGDVSGPQYATFRQNYGQLYNNPILQRYVNTIGQRLVPKTSPNIYSFKLLLDPVPRAEALSTGTVFVSTGMISLLDNEAQLAYVLGHEIAHIENNHAYKEIRNHILEAELYQEKEKSTEKKKTIFSAVAAGVGAATGGAVGGGRGAVLGAGIGLLGGVVASHFIFQNKMTVTEWSVQDENEADEAGLRYMLDQSYDVREIPSVYARLEKTVTKDARISLGFMGKPSRMKERVASIHGLLGDSLKARIDEKLKAGELLASSPGFPVLMSALKRDNGIIALDYDLFAMARDNLEEAVSLRSNDSRAQSYLGKVIAVTARSEEDRRQASTHFLKAIQYDEDRGVHADPHLERALFLFSQQNSANQAEIDRELQTYVVLYQRQHSGGLPNNMHIIYDYLTLAGDNSWFVPPAAEVSTRYGDALNVNSSGNLGPVGVKQIVDKSLDKHPASIAEPIPPARPASAPARKKNVSGTAPAPPPSQP
jgi:tetratricopeptide (TPR) repeat protein